jgi:hypothetical protein
MLPNLNLESPLSFKRDDDDARSAQKERKKRALGSARFEAVLWDLDRRRACST